MIIINVKQCYNNKVNWLLAHDNCLTIFDYLFNTSKYSRVYFSIHLSKSKLLYMPKKIILMLEIYQRMGINSN